jgi:WD40 repeat protein
MGWPLSQEYNEAVQNPRTSFGDPDLKAGEVVPGPLGIPMPRSGNFADVYQVHGADGRMWALKCFTRPASGLRDRYLKIDAQLQTARLPFSVGFEFLPDGVRIRGLWYPALKMEWVEGLQLNVFVRQNVDKPDHLKAILGLWVRLCKRLRDARIAHADLQHGNVLLVPGATTNTLKLRLIDYDGMWVPALANSPSGESGHPAYQHPARLRERTYSADVDRFPHLVIGCALRALAVAGKPLWDRFDNGDNLLFREVDFANPAGSALLRALWDLDDPTVTNLVALLIASAGRPIGDTPWLDEVLSGDKAVPVSDPVLAYAADTLCVPRRAARKPMPVAQIYVVPQEANEFTDLGAGMQAKRQSRGITKGTALLVGGGVAVAAAVIVAVILATRGNSGTTPPDDPSKDPQTHAPPTIDKAPPTVPAKTGIVETKWTKIAAGPPVASAKVLVAGIDVAPPGSKVIRTFPHSGSAALGAWMLPDGTHALVAGKAGLGVLDLHSTQFQPMARTGGELTHAAVSADCKHAVTATKTKTIHCIDLATGEEKWSQKFPGPIGALAITPDGNRVILSGEKIGYIEWAVDNGAELRRHELLQANHMALSPDGKWALAASEGSVELWSLDDAKVTVLAPSLSALAVCISPDGKLGFAAGGQLIKSWDLPDGQAQADRSSPLKAAPVSLAVTTEGTIVVGSQGGEVGLIGPEDPATIGIEPAGPVLALGLTGDGQYGLFASEKSNPMLCRVGDLVRPFGPSKVGPTIGCLEFVRSVQITPETKHFAVDARGERFLTASGSKLVVYDSTKFEKIDGFQVQGGKIAAAGFGPEKTVIVCQETDDKFRTRPFDLKTAEPGKTFFVPDVDLRQVSRITPVFDRPWVLATTEPTGDVLFDPETGQPVEGWPRPKESEPAVAAASPDGRRIALGKPEDPVRLWDCETMRLGARCEGSVGVNMLAYTPDSSKLIGLWTQGRMRIWDSIMGNLLKEVDHEYPGPFTDMAAITNELVVLTSSSGRLLLNIETGKAINLGDGPDPLAGRGIPVPPRGWILVADRDERLTAWRINPKLAASLPAKPPPKSPWPDIAVVRAIPNEPIVGLAVAADGESVLVAPQSGRLTRYSADRLLYVNEFDTKETPTRAMVPSGDRLFFLGKRANVIARDVKLADKPVEFASSAPTGAVPSLFVVHPDHSLFLLVTDKLRVTDMKTKKEIATAAVPKSAAGKLLTQFTYSTDGKVGVARWGDAVTAVWNPKQTGTAKILEELKTPLPASPHALALSPDGHVAILGTGDGKITAWDTKTGKSVFSEEVYPPGAGDNAVTEIVVLPGGTHFATAGRDGRVILWELKEFKKFKEYRGPEGPWRLVVSPDNKSLLMAQPGYIQKIDLPASVNREP